MPSQRERIHTLLSEIPSPAAARGYFGPEPGDYDLETARKLVRLGFEILDLGQRERSRHFEALRQAGKSWDRAELIQDDARLSFHAGLQALDEMLTCAPERVAAVRERAHSCLEQAGIAIADPDMRKGAEIDLSSRPRTRELLAARQGDAEERKRIREDLGRALGRAAEAEQAAATAQDEAKRMRVEIQRIEGRENLARELGMTRQQIDRALSGRPVAALSFDRPGEEITFSL